MVRRSFSNVLRFKQAVWSIKRGQLPSGALMAELPLPSKPTVQGDANTPLLADIREELRKMNLLLETKSGAKKLSVSLSRYGTA